MKHVAFLANAAQFRSFCRERDMLAAREWTVASGDVDVICECEARKQKVISLWDYFSPADMEEGLDGAFRACDRIAEGMGCYVSSHGCDLSAAFRYEPLFPLVAVLSVSRAVSRAMDDLRPAQVAYFSERASAFCWDAVRPSPDVFNAVTAWEAQRREIAAVELKLEPSAADGERSAATGQAKRSAPASGRMPMGRCAGIVSLFGDLGYEEQRALLGDERLIEGGAWLVLGVRPPDEPLPYACVGILEKLPFDRFVLREELSGLAREGIERIRADLRKEYPALSENPHLAFFWEEMLVVLGKAHNYGNIGRFAAALGPTVVSTGYDVFGAVKAFTHALQGAGVQVIALDHVGLASTESARFSKGARAHVAVWGQLDVDSRRSWRDPRSRIFTVGRLRSDEVPEAPQRHAAARFSRRPSGSRPRVVLFTTASAYGARMTAEAWPSDNSRCWDELLALSQRRSEWEFIIRTHPRYDHTVMYSRLVGRSGSSLAMASSPASELLDQADIAVLVNNRSTVAVEALRRQVPVLYLKTCVPYWLDSPIERGGAVVVQSVEDLDLAIERLVSDEDHRARVVRAQQEFLKKAVTATGRAAVDRLFSALGELNVLAAGEAGTSTPHRVSPSARWILDMVMTIDYAMRGDLARTEARQRLAGLQAQGNRLPFDDLPFMDMAELGTFLLDMVVWTSWAGTPAVSRPSMLLTVRKVLPRRFKPGWSVFRARLVHACLVSAEERGTGSLSALALRGVVAILAPGRVLALLSERWAEMSPPRTEGFDGGRHE